MGLPTILFLMGFPYLLGALNCDREFNYYDQYGKNGFDVICQGITKGYEKLLKNIAIFNEITLTIKDSRFENATEDLFRNVKNIRYLNVVNSTFTFPKGHQIFAQLNSLERLTFESTEINVGATTFKGLKKLLDLTLNNTNTSSVEKNSFNSLVRLRKLTVTHNKLTRLSDIPLCELKSLKQINLANNLLADIKFEFFFCKRRSSSSIDVSLNGNVQEVGVQDSFYSVDDNTFELLDINLSHNKIVNVGKALDDVTSLKYINLEGNLIEKLDNVTFTRLNNLVSIILSNNYMTEIEKSFDNKLQLKYLNLQHNKLQFVKIINVPMLQYLNLAYNNISNVSLDYATVLETLILKHNMLHKIDANFFKNLGTLVSLDLSFNYIIFTNDTFLGLNDLKKLFISGNSLIVLPELIFQPLKNLKVLDISSNELVSLTPNTLFQSLVKLEHLNVSYNKLETVNYDLLEPLVNLKVLDVSGNRLQNIQYDLIISNLPSISILNVRSNLLSCEILVEIIDFLKKKNIGYTASEHFDYTRENVAGIYCSNAKSLAKMNSKTTGESSVLFNFVVLLIIVLIIIIITVLIFKIYVYLKRRNYRADEFELVTE